MSATAHNKKPRSFVNSDVIFNGGESLTQENSNSKQSLAHSSHQTRNVELVIGFVGFRDCFVARKYQQHMTMDLIWSPALFCGCIYLRERANNQTVKVSCLFHYPSNCAGASSSAAPRPISLDRKQWQHMKDTY